MFSTWFYSLKRRMFSVYMEYNQFCCCQHYEKCILSSKVVHPKLPLHILEKSGDDSVYEDNFRNEKTTSLHLLQIKLYYHYNCMHRPLFYHSLDSVCLDHGKHLLMIIMNTKLRMANVQGMIGQEVFYHRFLLNAQQDRF